eukprot:TRINITY_DN34252_c0_g1_i1.p1 TRINITY_DN34252_c0_g1~~TRINITY_DN34252_c0_g1_i1.p1  ORF type:complete len:279 (+),score=79.35 TRINITY_DN34252_c0_g1_i1:62-838(+)
MPQNFRCPASDAVVKETAESMTERLKDFVKTCPGLAQQFEKDLKRVKENMKKWQENRPESVASHRLEIQEDDLTELLKTGLKWDTMKHVGKRKRREPVPESGADLPTVKAARSLHNEVLSVVQTAEKLDGTLLEMIWVMEFLTPTPREGFDPPITLLSLKAVIISIKEILKPMKFLASEFYASRLVMEEEYYKRFLTCDWKDAIDAFDLCTWQKLVRSQRLFIQVTLYIADLLSKNNDKLEKNFEFKKSNTTSIHMVC